MLFWYCVVVAAGGAATFWAFRQHVKGRDLERQRRARRDFDNSTEAVGNEGRGLLARCCWECERLVKRNPNNVYALHLWAAALIRLAAVSHPDTAERYLVGAEDKFSKVVALNPGQGNIDTDRASGLMRRGSLHPGEEGDGYLRLAAELCERHLVDAPRDPKALRLLGAALCNRGARSIHDAAKLYGAAEDRFSQALQITPHDEYTKSGLGITLARHARLLPGEAGDRLLSEAEDLSDIAPLFRAHILFEWTRRPGGCDFDRVRGAAANLDGPLEAQGVLLWTQARCSTGAEARELLVRAREKFIEAELQRPMVSAYNLGCVCAILGEVEESRRWLEFSREPGIRVTAAEMAGESELAGVRDLEWFRELVSTS